MMKYTRTNLKKIETLFTEQGYKVRYERGNFNAGYCIVQDQKIAIVNKFYDIEARINCLTDILQIIKVDEASFSESSLPFYTKLMKVFIEELEGV